MSTPTRIWDMHMICHDSNESEMHWEWDNSQILGYHRGKNYCEYYTQMMRGSTHKYITSRTL